MADCNIQELDGTLRAAITSFTAEFAAKMFSPILSTSSTEPVMPQASNTASILNPNWQPQIPPPRISSPTSVRSQSSNRMALPEVMRASTPLPPPVALVFVPTSQLVGASGSQLMQEIQENIEKEVRVLRDRLKEYAVGDWRTREALVGAVQVSSAD